MCAILPFICAATDGLERVAIPMSDWTQYTPLFLPLEDSRRETSNAKHQDEYLMMFCCCAATILNLRPHERTLANSKDKPACQLARSAKARSRYPPYLSCLFLICSPNWGKMPKFGGIG